MDEDEDDTHICLACHQTIVGLENYVKHRKHECPSKKSSKTGKATESEDSKPSDTSTSTEKEPVPSAATNIVQLPNTEISSGNLQVYHQPENTCISPVTTVSNSAADHVYASSSVSHAETSANFSEPTVDPAMFSDFFSSLELQSKTPVQPPRSAAVPGKTPPQLSKSPDPFQGNTDLDSLDQAKTFFDNTKKIANLLNELDFSSDSEGFNEDFLNFSDMDDELALPPPSRPRLYGKWKPGMQHYPGKHSPGKGGKHRHGTRGAKSEPAKSNATPPGRHRGKLDIYKDATESEEGHVDHQPPAKVERGCRGYSGKLEAYKRHHKADKLNAYKRSLEEDDYKSDIFSGEDEQEATDGVSCKKAMHHAPSCHGDGPDKEPQVVSKPATGGKCWPGKRIQLPESEEDEQTKMDDDVEKTAASKSPDSQKDAVCTSKSGLTCTPCGRSYVNSMSFERHLKSNLHKKRSASTPKEKQKNKVKYPSMKCPVCEKEFYNKFTFARHLVSPNHINRILYEGERESKEKIVLTQGMETLLLRLKPFQCRVCGFYCDEKNAFVEHLKADAHKTKCSELVGPLKCSKCKFSSRDVGAILKHYVSSPAHRKWEKNSRPSILREQRVDIPCHVCGKVVPSIVQFKVHMRVKHQGTRASKRKKARAKPSCTYCGATFSTVFALTIHIRRKHTKERPHKCDFCNVAFADRSTLNTHKRSQKHMQKLVELSKNPVHKARLSGENAPMLRNIRSYKCDHCFYRTTDHAKLRPHYLQEHAMNVYNCDICGMSFLKERIYESHLKCAAHKKKAELAEEDGHEIFPCASCGQKFYDERSYKVHDIFHKSSRPDEKTLAVILEDLDTKFHVFVKEFQFDSENLQTRFQCPECKKRLPQDKLLMHLRIHSNKDPYQCLFCKKGWKDRMVLIRHLETHLDTKRLPCQYCAKEFMRKKSLDRHVKQKHRDKVGLAEAAFLTCQHCGKEFWDKSALSAHLLTHEKKKKKCDFAGCRMTFRLESELRQHYRTHTNERPYLCDVCGYGGKTRNQLNRHRRVHTQERNYHCQYCTYKASNSTNLRRHMRIHIGSKPYSCPYCPHRANCVENIRKHILKTKQHAGMHIYPCKDCAYATNSAREIREHLIAVHGMDPDSVGVSSIYTGLYEKDTDTPVVPEGGLVHPVRDPGADKPPGDKGKARRVRRPRTKSRVASTPTNTDHAYVHNPAKGAPPPDQENRRPTVVIIPEFVYSHEPATFTVDGIGECFFHPDHTPVHAPAGASQEAPPYYDLQVEYVTDAQTIVEETVITHDVIEELLPVTEPE